MTTPHSRIPYLPARIEGLSDARDEPLVELEPRGAGALPLHRRSALASHPPQPARAALPGGSRAHRRLRQRQRLPPALRRRHGAAGARHDQPGHLVRPRAIPSSTAGRSPTSAPSSASTTRCRSTPAASACSPATTARPRAISACRWSASGLFYMKGYFDQRLRLDGWQEDSDEEYDVSLTPLVPVDRRQAGAVPHHGARPRDGRCTCAPGG